MTCVIGHLTNVEFTSEYKNWSHPPPETLFTAPVMTSVQEVSISVPKAASGPRLIQRQDKKAITKNIEEQARCARLLVIWTDCDREGEHIGQEIVDAARKGNAGIQVKRARFSNIERAYVRAVFAPAPVRGPC